MCLNKIDVFNNVLSFPYYRIRSDWTAAHSLTKQSASFGSQQIISGYDGIEPCVWVTPRPDYFFKTEPVLNSNIFKILVPYVHMFSCSII